MIFNKSSNEVIKQFNSNKELGLSSDQVLESKLKYGTNEINEKKQVPWIIRFLNQFKDAMIIMLIIAAVISYLVDPSEWIDTVIIMVVVIFNALIGMSQESKAEESLAALKKMSAPIASVLRAGIRIEIPSNEVVVGDIIFLEAGDFVSADARIIESYNLQVDESALTGESLPVEKQSEVIEGSDVALGDRTNMVYSSSLITYGRGVAVVVAVGMDSEVGKIADLLSSTESSLTPLQKRLESIGKLVGLISLFIIVIVFIMEYISAGNIMAAFKTAVALAVAAIPEGLPTVVTVVLSIGVTKMSKHNAIIRRLPAVETLGSASIVCSDKTGTLTQNKMSVVKYYIKDQSVKTLDDNLDDKALKEMLDLFTLSSEGEIRIEDNEEVLIGDPTETALISASLKFNQSKEDLLKEFKHIDELSFDSERKMMSVVYQKDNKYYVITKGAPDVILNNCNHNSEEYFKANDEMASDALRVLAVAYKELDAIPEELTSEDLESNLEFVGLVGLIDPPRPEVVDAISVAKKAGVRTIMITGDHIITAEAIARQLGILNENESSITGLELENLSDEQLALNIEKYSVYARVAPEQKVRIVKAWQAHNQVVAMTGDGVNDSPALKAADIGCAMGITGTEVAKGAAEMILTDDNFATIIDAIKQGRGIYENIKKDVHFLLSSNIGEIVAIFFASLIDVINPALGFGIPLLPIHLLWVNLITDSLPAFALGMEPIDPDIMLEKPRPKDEGMFAHGLTYTILWQGFMVGFLTLISYVIGITSAGHNAGMTMAFVTLSISELFHAYNLKSNKSILNKNLFNNKWLNGSFVIGMILQFLLIYVTPLATIFRLENLSFQNEMIALGLAMSVIPIVEISKLLKHLFQKDQH